jgi:hypothetical protein
VGNDIDLSDVKADEVTAVIRRAADLIAEHGWTPTKGSVGQQHGQLVATGRLTTLQAITIASHEMGGASPELHTASLDAVCLDVFGRRQGNDASVSRWDRQTAEAASEAYEAKLLELRFTVVDELRRIADSA